MKSLHADQKCRVDTLQKQTLSISEGLCKLSTFAFPIVTTALIQVSQSMTTLAFIGRLDSATYLGAVTLGNMVCNVTGFSLSLGMLTALDTLVAQAYGAKMYSLMGLHTQRAIVIVTLFTIPVIIIWTYTGEFLYYVLGIDYETSMLAGQWSKYIRYGIWPSLVFEIFRKFLQGQQIVWPVVVSALCSTVLNGTLNSFLVRNYHLGIHGPAMALVTSQWSSVLILVSIIAARKCVLRMRGSAAAVAYSHVSSVDDSVGVDGKLPESEGSSVSPAVDVEEADPEDNWPSLSVNIFRDWGPFLSLGVPGAFSLMLEWGSYETIASIAGRLGAVSLATHGIFMSTASFFYRFPVAISIASAILIGNRLGDNDAEGAKFFMKLGIWVDFAWGICAGGVLVLVLRPYWGRLYTDVEDVRMMVSACLPIMMFYITVDSTKCITLNVLRSTGRPGVTVIGNVVACLCVMLPLGYYLALRMGYGLVGLWFAMSMTWVMATFGYLYVVVFTDWQQQADLARERNHHALLHANTTRHAEAPEKRFAKKSVELINTKV